ncbi:zinc ribbon domain-containing protein [Actinosynnema mirum]|uniref:Putative FHA domain containing protein n=1 Tax=Actinosynnema mirum (strain ATCC 29888 / DSM 43827 / JCM 3225 / NBRC 14064 / NCIMB 13271 / NRRL B-12336 / IMRU 3971 / 101) TaxID=446462 RepID=C6WA09_ACTMD|nr:zinc ribbon domain-containing protein [Actinosynnema mirum]ACU39198.1 putative FHA domain containing protein [Actinosynnema mirum DSM 43827]
MIVCAQCGEHNVGGAEFCGACGTFLEWEKEPVGAAQGSAGAAQQVTAGQSSGAQPPGVQASGAQAVAAHQVPAQEGRSTPVAGPAPAATPAQPAPVQPAAVQPGAQQPAPARPQPKLTERRQAQPGDLICGRCGDSNPPTRNFCSTCGDSLAAATVVETTWWRRLFPRKDRTVAAGTRNRARRGGAVRKGVGRAVQLVLLVAVLLLGALYWLVDPFRSTVNGAVTGTVEDVRGVFDAKLEPVRPTAVSATAELPDHPAALVADNASNTHWAAPADPQPALVLDFGKRVDLAKAIVRSGVGADFQSAHRPQRLHLVYSTGRTHDVDLADTPDPQEVALANSEGADRVEVHVTGLHRSLSGSDVAISEIEFFAQK